jgi:putative polyhydroxyalkanoate system protein
MAKIHVTQKHHLDKAHIRQQVQQLAEKLGEELSVDYTWEEDRLVFERPGAKGHIEVREDEVEIEIQLGLLFTPLKGTVEKTITGYLNEHLA